MLDLEYIIDELLLIIGDGEPIELSHYAREDCRRLITENCQIPNDVKVAEYEAGHDDGHAEGYNEGYDEGFEAGIESCDGVYEEGYEAGYKDGRSDA